MNAPLNTFSPFASYASPFFTFLELIMAESKLIFILKDNKSVIVDYELDEETELESFAALIYSVTEGNFNADIAAKLSGDSNLQPILDGWKKLNEIWSKERPVMKPSEVFHKIK